MSRDQLDADLGGANPSRAMMRWHISCSPECVGSAARPPAARSPPSVGSSARPSTASRCACSARPRRFRFSMMFVVRAASAPAAPSPLSTSASAPPSTVSCPIPPRAGRDGRERTGSGVRSRGASPQDVGGTRPNCLRLCRLVVPSCKEKCSLSDPGSGPRGSRRFEGPLRGLSAYDPGRGRSRLFMERGFRPPGMLRFAVSACVHWDLLISGA